jgi:RNA polymerase sigma-70 factor (ECF subfamily)
VKLFRPDTEVPIAPPSGGETEVLTAMLTEVAPVVRACVHRYVGPSADADDIVQEALIEIAAALRRFRGESSVRTYALRIAYRVAGRHVRAIRRREQPVLHSVPADDRTPEAVAMQRESLRRLYRCLDRLSPKRRAAFVLCAIERMNHAEAAAVEGVSLETMRARLKHARAELGRMLRADPFLSALLSKEETE